MRELGHDVYDPALDEKKNLDDHEVREFRKWKTTDLPRFQTTIRKIIAWDLDWIEQKSDYVDLLSGTKRPDAAPERRAN